MATAEAVPGTTRSLLRVAVTVIVTLVVVCAEFGLLYSVYHRADPIRRQLLVQYRLAGQTGGAGNGIELDQPPTPSPTQVEISFRVAAETATALVQLRQAGVAPRELAPIQAAARAVVAQPGSTLAVHELDISVKQLGTALAEKNHRYDLEASAFYAILLVTVSGGWFLWFRRVVARQRALQQAATRQQALATSEQRLTALVQNGADLVMVFNVDSTASFVSPSSLSVVGHPADELIGRPFIDLVVSEDVPLLVQLLAAQHAGDESMLTVRMNHADGRRIVAEGMLTNLLADPAVGGFVLTVRDVTERHAMQERLTHQAFHDSLTGLANRQLFADRLSHALERRTDPATPLVVLFCDLDDFKNINDTHGHGLGDHVLEVIGERIRKEVRTGDTAARLGGDEFAILMEGTDLTGAEPIAQRLVEILKEPVLVDGVRFPVTASIGMAQAFPGEITSEDVLRNADVAMYWAKDRGKSTIAVYDSSLHAEALDRLELRADLQRALRGDELVLHYQPTIELETGKITGFEALVRWQHPERGLLSPYFFVPMAEETGLIVELGTWVLFEACRTGAELQKDWRKPSMAVNISSQQLSRPDFVDEVGRALAMSGMPPFKLVLEITESVVLHDLNAIIPRLAALRKRGVRVAIDDFGTGYSSLAYLIDLPIDVLKVDKSFIDRIASDQQGASVTEAIIAMSHSMKLSTVAEGVEVAEQAAWLRRVHCPLGQGFFWSRPVDLDGVRRMLETQSTASPDIPEISTADHLAGLR